MYTRIIRPILFKINPEIIHNVVLRGLNVMMYIPGLPHSLNKVTRFRSDRLTYEVFGRTFPHPIGLAAGLDKYGSAVGAWEAFDFSFAEVGSVCNESQPGNEKPRLWRIPEKKALQVNFGLNSKGAEKAEHNVRPFFEHKHATKIGISIAKTTRVSEKEASSDYLRTFKKLHAISDYITLNVSCPNVCNFTEMQHGTFVEELFKRITAFNEATESPSTIFVKIGPDLSDKELFRICDLVLEYGIDGIIATNLLKKYDEDVVTPGKGGLSGSFVRDKSTGTIRKIYTYLKGAVPIIGLGGVYTGKDALDKIKAGASLVQIYTSFIYRGPLAVRHICRELDEELEKEGFEHYADAIGVDA